MEVGIIDQPQEKVVNFVLFELLERQDIYTHILQKIFLYLDPKSLKNSKLTCSQWKVFIEKEIWKSVSGKKVLQDKLMSNWKDKDFVKVSNINLSFGVTCAECDKDVMVFCMDDGLGKTSKKNCRFGENCIIYLTPPPPYLKSEKQKNEILVCLRPPLPLAKSEKFGSF